MKIEINFTDKSKLWCSEDDAWGYMGGNETMAHREFWINIKERGYLNNKYLVNEQLTKAF